MTTLRNYLAVALFALCAMTAPSLHAAEIATVSLEALLKDSKAVESLKKQAESERDAIQKDIKKKDEKLAKEGEEIQKKRGVLAEDAYKKEAEAFEKKANDLRKELQDRMGALNNAHVAAMEDIKKTLLDIVKDIAEDKKVDAVLQSGQLLYLNPKMDITQDVIKALNKKLSDVKLTVKK